MNRYSIRRIICAGLMAAVMCVSLALTGCNKTNNVDDGSDASDSPQTMEPQEVRSEYMEHLETKYADYQELSYGLDITKKTDIVSICYSTWFTKILGAGNKEVNPPNVTEILAGNQEWGGNTAFHYWAKPALGYYRSDDKSVIRTHMTQLADAGVDFIIIDNTNASVGWKSDGNWRLFITMPCKAILDTIVDMREEGLKTPYVVFWSSVSDEKGWSVLDATYEQFHAEEKWKDCFVYWEGKPLMLSTSMISEPLQYDVTVRHMWGLNSKPNVLEWSFLNVTNVPTLDADGFVEQTCVCTATQETYMTEPTAHGRDHGIFMYEQWKNAFAYRPKVVTLTWWNEWCAQLFRDDNNNPRFVDNYNAEYSRDLEPMEGGHGDTYYRWMCQYIAAYRNGEECPRLVEEGY